MMSDVKFLLVHYKIHYTALKIKVIVVVIDQDRATEHTDHPDHGENVLHQDIVNDPENVNVTDLIVIEMIVNVTTGLLIVYF